MMEVALPRSWKEEFAFAASMKREDILYREKMARFEARQRQMTAEQALAAKQKEAEASAFLDHALAPPARIAEFRTRLDGYDTKTVEALMENQEATEAVRRSLDEMLGKAHVLPDGRRVFKTNDGQHVFDEYGTEVQADTVDPSSIDDKKPKWETFKGAILEQARLGEERQGLLDYQAKLDEARERLERDDLTVKELDDLDAGLTAVMPEAVREKLGLEKPKPDAAPNAPSPLDGMDALMQQTGLGPASPPGPQRIDRQTTSAPAPF